MLMSPHLQRRLAPDNAALTLTTSAAQRRWDFTHLQIDGGQVRFPVVERRMIARQGGEPAVHEVPERLPVRWNDLAVPARSMHPLIASMDSSAAALP